MENMFCNSCPICTKRKYAIETGKMPPEDEIQKLPEEIETVDVESCNDDVPDSGSEIHHQQQTHQQVHHAHMPALSGSSSHSSSHSSSNGAGGVGNSNMGANLHNSNSQPGKLDGILYRTACVMNKDNNGGMVTTGEDDISTNVATISTSSNSSSGSTTNWTEAHASSTATHGHISGKFSKQKKLMKITGVLNCFVAFTTFCFLCSKKR